MLRFLKNMPQSIIRAEIFDDPRKKTILYSSGNVVLLTHVNSAHSIIVRLIMRMYDMMKGGGQMNDQEQNFKAGDAATFTPNTGAIGIWSSHLMGVAA